MKFLRIIIKLSFTIFFSLKAYPQELVKPNTVTITFDRLATLKPQFLYEKNERLYFQNDQNEIFIAQKMSHYYENQVYKKPEFIPQKDSLGREYKTLEDFIHSQLVITDTNNLSFINLTLILVVNSEGKTESCLFKTEKGVYHTHKEIKVFNQINSILENKKYWSPANFDSVKVNSYLKQKIKLYCTVEEIEKIQVKPQNPDPLDSIMTLPKFPGGQKEELEYFTRALLDVRKPKEYEKKHLPFRVTVVFNVEKNGEIKDVFLTKGKEELNEFSQLKIINAFLNMPKWTPAIINNEPQNMRFAKDLKF